ncbi:hypothetical protein IW261DRAFT_1573656 [Armillaria novae-zelandiae]|uniref:Uncharacterized protein n=1 Tax=Armillaria novae-zelandiae TaxID=153914 RepID=A0AA39NNB7_9AGAR|nr:hypothetical protein IW261DRAFT_1573656 [Armillaria novae-zelandiae]
MSFSSGSPYATGHTATPSAGLRAAGLSSSPDAYGNKITTSHFRPPVTPPSTPSRKGRSSGVGPERSPHRSRSRPQSPTNNYRSSRTNSNHRPRASTPPPIPADADSPFSPASIHNQRARTIYQGMTFQKVKAPSVMQHLLSLPSANLSAVPRRGSTPAIETRFQLAKNHASTSSQCSMTPCAYWKSSAYHNDYEMAHKMKPPQPGDVVHFVETLPRRFAGKVEFKDKHLAIHPNDPNSTDILAGVSLVDVLLAEAGNSSLALVDGESPVRFINGTTPTTIDLTININGYPSYSHRIAVSCAHGQVTRRGLLHAIAQGFYHATKSGPPRAGHEHGNIMFPNKVSLDELRLVSIYALDHNMWFPQLLYCASEKKPRK